MISIIICSKKKNISANLRENIKITVGLDYEIIVIDNSNNNHSIFSAYNNGIIQSKFPFLCFVHEDVLFHTKDWGKNLVNHLSDKKTGIIGIAGAKIMTKTPASWSVSKNYKNILQRNRSNSSTSTEREPRHFQGIRQSAILLDGVFLAMRRKLFDEILFDENFISFHGYDYDISVQSIVSGYNNYVVYDILLEHFSKGTKNQQYYLNLMKIHRKWEKKLPLMCNDVSEETKSDIQQIEIKRLKKLVRRLTRAGFSTIDILTYLKTFIDILGTKKAKKELKFVRIRVFIERLFKTPKYLFK